MSGTALSVERATPDSNVILPTWSMPPDVDIHALLEYRAGQARRREWKPLGILEKVMLEASGIYDVSDANPLSHNLHQSANFDYYKTGPLVGITADGQDLLIVTPMAHPPDLPDPSWRPSYPPKEFINGIPVPEVPPRIPQRLRDRAAGILPAESNARGWKRLLPWQRPAESESDFWFVCQPVHQVLLLLSDRTGLGMVECSADIRGRHTALLYNPHRQEGHLIFGAKTLELYRA